MQESELSDEVRILVRRCDDLCIDVGDALGAEARWQMPSETPSINMAIDAHVDVLLNRARLIEAARVETEKPTSDPRILYQVAAALALIEELAPWPRSNLRAVRSHVDPNDVRIADDSIVEHYRAWLSTKTGEGLSRTELTVAGAMAISLALGPQVEEPDD